MRQKLQKPWIAGQIKTSLFLSVQDGSVFVYSVLSALSRIGLWKGRFKNTIFGNLHFSGGDSPAVILSFVAGRFGELLARAFPAKAES